MILFACCNCDSVSAKKYMCIRVDGKQWQYWTSCVCVCACNIENAKQTILLEASMSSYCIHGKLLLNKFKWRIRKFITSRSISVTKSTRAATKRYKSKQNRLIQTHLNIVVKIYSEFIYSIAQVCLYDSSKCSRKHFSLRFYNCSLTEINANRKFHLWIDVTQLVPFKKLKMTCKQRKYSALKIFIASSYKCVCVWVSFRPRVWLDKNKTQRPTTDDISSFRFVCFVWNFVAHRFFRSHFCTHSDWLVEIGEFVSHWITDQLMKRLLRCQCFVSHG